VRISLPVGVPGDKMLSGELFLICDARRAEPNDRPGDDLTDGELRKCGDRCALARMGLSGLVDTSTERSLLCSRAGLPRVGLPVLRLLPLPVPILPGRSLRDGGRRDEAECTRVGYAGCGDRLGALMREGANAILTVSHFCNTRNYFRQVFLFLAS